MLRLLLNGLFARVTSWIGASSERLVWSPLVVACRDNVQSATRIMIVAHPDDESLFGGEALTSLKGWMVVCVTNAGVIERRQEFVNAMNLIKANYVMLNHADHLASGNFDPSLERQLAELIAERPWEMIVTHGRRGEYGHTQHKAVHQIVCRLAPRDRIFVFGARWWGRSRISAAKEQLLACYQSQESIRRFRYLAGRECLRALR